MRLSALMAPTSAMPASVERVIAPCGWVTLTRCSTRRKSSVHTPLTAETRGLIGAEAFAAAKRGMILINTSRGPVVDIDALYDAMKDGTVQAAGLDVLPEEPANAQRRLIAAWQKNEDWIRHRLLLTPHSAFYTPESMRDNRAFAARTAARFLRDGRLENCVNKQFLVAKG